MISPAQLAISYERAGGVDGGSHLRSQNSSHFCPPRLVPQIVNVEDIAPDGSSPEKREPGRRLATLQETLGLSDAEEQILGKRWNFQQKFDAKLFYKSVEWTPNVYNLPAGVCDV